jgi:SH3 domain-containing protein
VSYAPQSSPGLLRLPACALVACLAFATPAAAQSEQALTAPATLHTEPEGVPLVTLPAGTEVETGRARGDWHQATVEGWIVSSSTQRTTRNGFDLVVTPDGGENLRRTPNGPVVGRVREGTLLERLGQKGHWSHVRRAGWIPRKAISPVRTAPGQNLVRPDRTPRPNPAAQQPATPRPPAQQPVAQQPAAQPAAPPAGKVRASADTTTVSRLQTVRETPLGATAEGASVATLASGTPARVVARSGDWVKVQVEGWVPADALAGADGAALLGVSADELHATPDRYIGQTLEWRLQVIAVRRADQLRPEMPLDTPYLLTRGPLPEPGFVYVTIPATQVAAFQALPALQEVVVRATVRAARTRFLSTPVVDLVSVVSGMDGK